MCESGYLDKWEKDLCEEYFCGSFGLVDIAVYCSTFNLFRYVMVPTWRSLYPNISLMERVTRWLNGS